MPLQRLAVYSAETRNLAGVAYLAGGNPTTITSVRSHTGGFSYALIAGVAAFGKALTAAKSAVRLGYWLYLSSTTIQANNVLYFAGPANVVDEDSYHIRISYNLGNGRLEIKRPQTATTYEVLASVPLPAAFTSTGVWIRISFAHKIHASTGFLTMYVNGVAVLTFTGDTRPSRFVSSKQYSTTASYVMGAGGYDAGITGFAGANVDDMVLDASEGEADGPMPKGGFLFVTPTGTGAEAQWTASSGANYTTVDEVPHDSDASYNRARAAGLRDTFAMGDVVVPENYRIAAALPLAYGRRTDVAVEEALSLHAWDGLHYEDSADLPLKTTYDAPVMAQFIVQPDGSLWTEEAFNAMQFGYRSRGTY